MKQLRIKVLERVIKHMIHGEKDRAARLMEKLMAAVGSQIINEANYGNGDDPMFPARRELQRELEDDMEQDRVEDPEADLSADLPQDGEPTDANCDEEDCSPTAVAQMISDLVKAGGVDEDKLAQIVDIIIGGEGEESEGELDGADLGTDEVPGAEDGADLPPEDGQVPAELPAEPTLKI